MRHSGRKMQDTADASREGPRSQQTTGPSRRTLLLVGLGVSAVFLWLALGRLEFSTVERAIRDAQPLPWVPLAVASYLLGQLVRGLRCRRLVRDEADLPVATASNIVVLGYAVNNVLPARLGELARAGFLAERTGIPLPQTLTFTLVERLLDGWTLILLFIVAAASVLRIDDWMIQSAQLAGLLFALISLCALVLMRFPLALANRLSDWAARLRPTWREPMWRWTFSASNGLAPLRQPAAAFQLLLLSVLIWCAEAGMFLFILAAFDLPLNPAWALLAMTLTNLMIVLPSAPGYIGPFHYFCMQALVLLGVAEATAAAYAVVVHGVFYIPVTIWGVAVVLRYGVEIGAMKSLTRAAAAAPSRVTRNGIEVSLLARMRPTRPRAHGDPLLYAISEALVPPDSEGNCAEVADFVQGQVAALPVQLRFALFAGLAGFRCLIRLRYLRSFSALPLETRRTIVTAFAYGPFALTRQLFRVLRSTALLSHYERAERSVATSKERA
jgi:uncharacterized protein (TIRG00374 family)